MIIEAIPATGPVVGKMVYQEQIVLKRGLIPAMRTAASTLLLRPMAPRVKRQGVALKKMQLVDVILKVMVPAMLLVFFAVSMRYGSLDGYMQLLSRQSYVAFIPALGAIYTLLLLLFQVVRTVLWGLYKPYDLPPGELPKVTVIIPAYNEGAMVEKAIYAVTGANYPSDKLEIICIDDGSKDDTWTYISRAQRRFPQLIKAIQFPEKPRQESRPVCRVYPGRRRYFYNHRL